MNTIIRKISVGTGFPDRAMHYQVGKPIRLNGEPYDVIKIELNRTWYALGKSAFDIFIKKALEPKAGVVLWKTVIDLPVVIENNIDFE